MSPTIIAQHGSAACVTVATVYDVHPGNAPAPNSGTVYAGAEPARSLPSASAGTVVVVAKRAARRDSGRVFWQFAWLKTGSGKAALSHPAHQPSLGCYAIPR